MEVQRRTGGYQAVASVLTARSNYPWSRQQVYMWWTRRDKNGFPEGDDRPSVGQTAVREFIMKDVIEWFDLHYPESRLERLRWLKQARKERRTRSDGSTTT